jgi:phytoene dehydrogenase-like protein
MRPAYDVIVIGAGANGLVAAARLGQAGKRVLLLERAEGVGGQGTLLEFAPGFKAAPLATDAGWVPDGIAKSLGLSGLDGVMADTPLSVADGNGGFLTLSRDARAAAAAISSYSQSDASKWGEFTARLHTLSGMLEEIYQAPAPDVDITSLGELWPLVSLGRKFRALGPTAMIEFLRTLPLSVQELVDDWFECGPLKAAVAAGGIQDFQQGPRSGGTSYVLLHHLVGAPEGSVRGRIPHAAGPGAFTDAALDAVKRHGVMIRTGAAVARILVKDDTVTGVALGSGEEIAAGAVLSTADPATTFLRGVDPVWLDPEFVRDIGNVRHRGCTAYVMYALDALPELRGLAASSLAGIVSLTSDLVALERAADAAKYGTVSDRPHVELHAPTVLWPSLAPAGKHVLVARVQYAPYRLKNAAWTASRMDELAAKATAAIEGVSPGFSSRVLDRASLSPLDLEGTFGLRDGATSQGELALDQILFMRPVAGWGRHTTPLCGLFLGGVGTHPGPGVLGGAGWLAAERVLSGRKARA